MKFSAREDVISITPLNPFDRFDDGRPKITAITFRLDMSGISPGFSLS